MPRTPAARRGDPGDWQSPAEALIKHVHFLSTARAVLPNPQRGNVRLSVQHRTTYRYARPVMLQPHRLMLCPRGGPELRVLDASLVCQPAAELAWTEDVFGNLAATATFAEPTAELVIASSLSVELTAEPWPVFRVAPHAHSFPFAYSPADLLDLGALLVSQAGVGGTVAEWARRFVYSAPTDTLSLLKDLNTGVLSSIAYRTRDEEGTQAAAETLSLGSGSCRDLSALFVDAVRHLGFGARAVSGYLYDPDASEGDARSTHAWAEVYLPSAGWIAFDPTHRRVGGAGLIPLAVGRSNEQIMPVVGGYVGSPEDFVEMDVSVRVAPDVRSSG